MVASPLVPQRPPGRSSRKASAYGAEIQRLRAAGYTLDTIREALADAGIVVSRSTVHREATRRQISRPSVPPFVSSRPPEAPAEALVAVVTTTGKVDTQQPTQPRPQRGRDIAAAFVGSRINNPLLRKDQR